MTALDLFVSAVIGGAAWCPAVDAIAGALEARYGIDGDLAEMWAIAEVRRHRAARDRGEMRAYWTTKRHHAKRYATRAAAREETKNWTIAVEILPETGVTPPYGFPVVPTVSA